MASYAACESDLVVVGLQPGEQYVAPVRIAATLIAVTITSAWFSVRRIKRLSLFFAHWLSGMVMSVGFAIDDMMVSICWATSNLEGFIKTVKFIELTASNMLAITNLVICINLALIISSHRTQTRVKSVSSPRVIMMFLVVSLVIAAASIPFWDIIVVVGTGFWFTSNDEVRFDTLNVLIFIVELIVGICMLGIVSWLLVFRLEEIKECWRLHRNIRYYFGLTILGTAVNLSLGICGTINIVMEDPETLLLSWSWLFRFIHIALDTIVLYGVLGERGVSKRTSRARSDGASSGQQAMSGRGGTNGASNGQPVSARGGARKGPRESNLPKSVARAPPM